MKELVCSEQVRSSARRVRIHKSFLTVPVIAVFFLLAALQVNAQCNVRPRTFSQPAFPAVVEWLIDGTFSENCTLSQGGWFFGNATRALDNGFCGWVQNSYARLSQNSTVYQRFKHDGLGSSQFWLVFEVEGGNPSPQAVGELDVWIYNATNNNWTLVDVLPSNSPISCGHKSYSFNRPDWIGKTLYVYFDNMFLDDGNWEIDEVSFQQQR